MKRTQISLPQEDLNALRRAAKTRGVSMAALIRELVARHVQNRAPHPPTGAALLRLADRAIRGRGPRNLSERIHETLYGSKSRWAR